MLFRSLAVFSNDGRGNFKRWVAPALSAPLANDLAGLAGWTPTPGRRVLLAAQSGLRTPDSGVASLAQVDLKPGSLTLTATFSPLADVSANNSSAGPVAVADVDGDGDLDVFVGGRAVPARYPEAASSQLLLNDGGTLKDDATANGALKNVGLVSGAVFSDLNGDGLPELILACEWGQIGRASCRERV